MGVEAAHSSPGEGGYRESRSLKDLMIVQRRAAGGGETRQAEGAGERRDHGRAVLQSAEWCAQAEASGIRALCDFANRLPAYVGAPAGAWGLDC